MILDKVNNTQDLRALPQEELALLASELREEIINVVSRTGGHLASSLGVVDLTIALHYSFDTPHDRIVWAVGHQAPAPKIPKGTRAPFPPPPAHGGVRRCRLLPFAPAGRGCRLRRGKIPPASAPIR